MHYYVAMIDYGRRGREAIVNPEHTYQNMVEMVRSGELKNILFIHRYEDGAFEDVTDAIRYDAGATLQAAE